MSIVRLLKPTGLFVAFSLFSGTALAATVTGDPLGANPFGWTPNSTNALNYDKLVPGREGQDAPYVLFVSNGLGTVTLEFNNDAPGLAFFETRIDGVQTGATSHPVVSGDTIHTGGTGLASGVINFQKQFVASLFVDIRLALGGERDWDFDWTRFEVAVAPVPIPAALPLFASALGLFGWLRWRRRNAAA